MHQLRRPAIALLVLWTSWPTLALGQEVKAGVVTALEGAVTATRAALPQPVPLKFKDDVFLRDRIATGDRSLARVLLGGKALVTVREHSVLTITEVPGRSTLELETGKIGLAAARERMRPGEIIDIRTPNAVAAIRGTVVVAEVVRAGAQASGGGIPATTRFYVLRDPSGLGIQVTHLDPVTRAPIAPPVNVGVMQRLTVTGSAPATVTPLPTAQVGQVVSGLQPSASQHQDAPAAQEQAISQSVATAVALVNTIVGPAPTPTTTTTTTEGTTTTTEGSTTGTQDTQLLAQPTTTATESVMVEQSVTSPPITVDTGGLVTTGPPPPYVSLTGAVTLGATDHVEQFSGSTSYDGAVYASITGATVSGPGGAPATNSLLVVDPTADVTLTGSLALVQDSTLSTSQALLDVGAGASLASSSTTGPLLVFDPSTVIAHDVIRIAAAATLEVAAGLLSDVGGTFTATNNFLTVNGTLIDTGPGPLLSFSGSDVTVGRHLVQIGAGGSLTVGGDLVRLKDGSALGVGAPATPGTLLALAGGATPTTATIPGAVVKFEGAGDTLSVTNSFAPSVFLLGIPVHLAPGTSGSLSMGGPVVTGPGTLTINGAPLSDTVTGSLILLSGVGYEVEIGPDPIDGSQPEILGQSVELPPLTPWIPATAAVTVSGSTLALGPGIPLVTFPTGSHTWAVPKPFAFIKGSSSVSSVESLFRLDPGADVTLAAALALVQDSTLSTGEALLEVAAGASLKGVGGPLLVFDPSTVSADEVIRIASGASVEVTTGLLSDVGGSFSATNNFLAVSGTLTHTGSGPLLSLSGSAVSAVNLAAVGGGAVDLGGAPLLMGLGSAVSLKASLLALAGGSFLGSATPDPLIQLTGGSVSVGIGGPAPLVSLDGDSTMMSLAGPLLGPLVGTPGGGTISVPGSTILSLSGGAHLASATPSPLIDLSGGTLTGGGALRVESASALLAGPFFRATGTTISPATGQPFIRLIGSVLETGGPLVDLVGVPPLDLGGQPLIRLDGASTLTVTGGPTIRLVGSTLVADALLISDGSGNFTSLTGTALDLTDSTVTLRTPSEDILSADPPGVHALALNEPYIRLERSTLTTTEVDDHLVRLGDNTTGMVEQGVALVATGTAASPGAINIRGMLLKMQQVESQATEALVQLSRTTLTQAGTTRALFEADPAGLFVSMAGPLLGATDSVISASGSIFELLSGSLDSTGAGPFIAIDPSTVTTARHFALLTGGAALSLTGSFLEATDTIFSATDPTLSFFAVVDGASVATTGTSEPLLKFTGTTAGASAVTAARNFLVMAITTPGSPSPSMALSGPLLDAVMTDIKTGDGSSTSQLGTLLVLHDSATLMSTSTSPLLSFAGSSVDASGPILTLRRSTSVGAPTTMTLAGPLFSATGGSTFNTSTLGFGSVATAPAACCDGFFVGEGAKLESSTTEALIQLTDSSFSAGPDAQSGGNFFGISDSTSIAGGLVAPATVTLAGPLLEASGSTVGALFNLLSIARSSISSTTADPLITLADSTVTLGGTDPFTGAASFGRVLGMFSTATDSASLDLAGPLLSATGTTITANRQAFGIFDGSTLASTTASPLIAFAGGSATAGENWFVIASGSALPASTMTLAGPLLSASGAALANGDPAVNAYTFVWVGDSTVLTSASPLPLLSFDAASGVDTSGNFFSLRRSKSVGEPTTMALAGPLFAATGGSSFNTTSLGLGSACCNGFYVAQGAKLESTTTEALVQLSDSAFNAGPDAQSGGNFFLLVDAGSATELIAPATVSLAGPLLEASGSTISALSNLLGVTRSSLTSTSTDPLVSLSGSTVALGGVNPFTGTTMSGSLLFLTSSATSGTPGSPASVTLAGPFLEAVGSTITATGHGIGIVNGAKLESTSPLALIKLDASNLTIGSAAIAGSGRLLALGGLGGPTGLEPATVSLAGPLLLANGGSNLDLAAFVGASSGADVIVTGSTDPFISISGGTHSLGMTPGAALITVTAGASVAVSDMLLSLTDATVTSASSLIFSAGGLSVGGALLDARGGSFTSTTTSPFIGFATEGGSVTSPTQMIRLGDGFALSLKGGVLSATDTTFNTTSVDHSFFPIHNGASVTTTATSTALLTLGGTVSGLSAVNAARNFVVLSFGDTGTVSPSMTLSGPLLSAVSTDFKTGDGSSTSQLGSLLVLHDSATLTSTSTSPLISFDSSSVDASGNIVTIRRSKSVAEPTTMTLAGPLFSASGGSSFNTSTLGYGSIATAPGACCSGFSISQGAKLESTTASPLIQFTDSTFNAGPDIESGGSLFSMSDSLNITGDLVAPATVSLAGPLLSASSSTITALSSLLPIGRSSMSSTTTDPLITLISSTVSLGGTDPFTGTASYGRVLSMYSTATSAASLGLAGPLLGATGTTITTNRSAFGVFDGSTLSSTTPSPLISITGGSVAAGENFLTASSATGLPSSSISLGGPLLSASGTTLTSGDPAINAYSFVWVADSATFTSSSPAALLSFDATSVDAAGNLLSLRRSKSVGEPTTMTLAGPLFAATGGSSFNTTTLGWGSACCNGFSIGQGAKLESSTTEALVQLSGSTFSAGPDVQSGGSVFSVYDAVSGVTELIAPATVTLAGPLLSASSSTITALFDLLTVGRSSVSSTGTAPFIALAGSAVDVGGINPFTGTASAARIVGLYSSAAGTASLSLAGPLLSATGTGITANREAFGVFDGSTLTSTTPSPLISLAGGSVTTGEQFFQASSGTGLPGSSVTLAGPLLSATGGAALATGDPTANTYGFSIVANSGTLSSTSPSPLLSFDSSSVDSAGNLVDFRTGASVTLAGPLFTATGGSSFNSTTLGFVGASGPAACCNGFRWQGGATFTSTTPSALIQLTGSTFDAGPDVQSGGQFAYMSDTGQGTETVAPPSLSLAGPFLSASGSTITSLYSLLYILRASLTSTTPSPLIDLSGSSGVSVGGTDPFAPATPTRGYLVAMSRSTGGSDAPATMTLAGPLLKATGSTLSATGDAFGIFSGATLTSSTPSALVQLDASSLTAGDPAFTADYQGVLLLVCCKGGPAGTSPASVSLAGPLLSAIGGSAISLSGNGLHLSVGGLFSSTSAAPLVQLTDTSWGTTNGRFLGVFDAGTAMTLGGGLLQSTNSPVTVTKNFVEVWGGASLSLAGALLKASDTGTTLTLSTGNAFLSISSGGVLTKTGAAPLVDLLGSDNDMVRLQHATNLASMSATATVTDVLTLEGSLLKAVFSKVESTGAGTNSSIFIQNGAVVRKSPLGDTSPFVDLDTGTFSVTGALLNLRLSASAALRSKLILGDAPLLRAINSSAISTSSGSFGTVFVAQGGQLSSTASGALVQLDASTLDAAGFPVANLNAVCTGCPGSGDGLAASITLASGGLLSAVGGSTVTAGAALFAQNSTVTTTSTGPLVLFDASTGAFSSAAGFGEMVRLMGTTLVADSDPDAPSACGGGGACIAGDKPLQHAGTVVEARAAATVTAPQAFRLDTALLEATKPLLDLKTGAALTASTTDLIGLNTNAKLTASIPGDALVKLNASTLTVTNGSLVNLTGGSFMKVTGSLLSLVGGSTLTINNGGLVTVAGGSAFSLTGGSLATFGALGVNTLTVNTTPCGVGCAISTTIPNLLGIPVALKNGAVAGNVSVTAGFTAFSGGAPTLTGTTPAVLVVDGATSKIKLTP